MGNKVAVIVFVDDNASAVFLVSNPNASRINDLKHRARTACKKSGASMRVEVLGFDSDTNSLDDAHAYIDGVEEYYEAEEG